MNQTPNENKKIKIFSFLIEYLQLVVKGLISFDVCMNFLKALKVHNIRPLYSEIEYINQDKNMQDADLLLEIIWIIGMLI